MPYAISTYAGDDLHTINCTGDVVTGDRVCFERATYTGSFRSARFAGFERVEGEIVHESYGVSRQQHTFTLRLADGRLLLIKGRNLYANGTWRQAWADEAARDLAATEKHTRGDKARSKRNRRRDEQMFWGRA